MGETTGTTAIRLTASNQVVSLELNEIKADIAYQIDTAPADNTKGLFLNCLQVLGSRIGNPQKDSSVFTNNYNELINKPTALSQFTNDTNFQNDTQVDSKVTAHNDSETAHSDIRALLPSTLTYNSAINMLILSLLGDSTRDVVIPVESDSVDGLSPKGTGSQIANHELRLNALESIGI
jgi:hypothetical protein